MSNIELNIDLDEHGRSQMYDELCEMFSEEELDETLEAQIIEHITQMFDNRERLQSMEEQ
jgi:hypothetical protein